VFAAGADSYAALAALERLSCDVFLFDANVRSEEALRLANVRYAAGTATQLDVLTSQVALTDARLNQLQAYYGYNVALAAMREAIGQADPFVTNG